MSNVSNDGDVKSKNTPKVVDVGQVNHFNGADGCRRMFFCIMDKEIKCDFGNS